MKFIKILTFLIKINITLNFITLFILLFSFGFEINPTILGIKIYLSPFVLIGSLISIGLLMMYSKIIHTNDTSSAVHIIIGLSLIIVTSTPWLLTYISNNPQAYQAYSDKINADYEKTCYIQQIQKYSFKICGNNRQTLQSVTPNVCATWENPELEHSAACEEQKSIWNDAINKGVIKLK